jgi:hypothetical protein
MSESKTETIEFYDGDNLIVRTVRFPVPGGWIYQTATASRGGGGVHQIFVPQEQK